MSTSSGRLRQTLDLTWDLDLDTNDTTTHLVLPADAPFRGDWTLTVTVKRPQWLKMWLNWKQDASQGSSWKCDPPAVTFSAVDADEATGHTIWRSWTEVVSLTAGIGLGIDAEQLQKNSRRRPAFDPTTQRRFRLSFTITGLAPPVLDTSRTARVLADRVTSSFASKRPNDIRFYFPRFGAELWASASFLDEVSPYFKTLLESDFAEGARRRGKKRARVGDCAGAIDALVEESEQGVVPGASREDGSAAREGEAEDDSDDETDAIIKQSCPPSIEDNQDDGDFTYREVGITETAYSTYRAVLLYLHSECIDFAPLNSTFLPFLPSSEEDRQQYIETALLDSPRRPPPVSPKSVYRLAHLLEIPSLLALALAELKRQISVHNAARELFSSTSVMYDDVRAMIMDLVVAHWEEVRKTEGWRDMQVKAKADELPGGARVLAELIGRV